MIKNEKTYQAEISEQQLIDWLAGLIWEAYLLTKQLKNIK